MELEYRLEGPDRAPVLVLSNSLGTTFEMWQPQLAALTQQFRVLRYNTRGHGRSPLPAGPLTLARLGQDVVELLDALHIEHAAFCGISLGGLTGLWLNRYAPARFSTLVVANTAARIGSEQGWRERAAQVRAQGMEAVASATPQRWFTPEYVIQHATQIAALVARLARQNPSGYAACCEVLATADLRDELPQMLRPMLVIAGRHDPVTGLDDARQIVQGAPHATLASLAASHLSNIACAAEFTRCLIHFIGKETKDVVNH